jgi:hypothetical protein
MTVLRVCWFPGRFVAVDASPSATLAEGLELDDSMLAVLKPQVLKPLVLNNRYLFHGFSHLAFIPGEPFWGGSCGQLFFGSGRCAVIPGVVSLFECINF